MVKLPENKSHQNVSFERMDNYWTFNRKKMMDFDYREKYLRSISSKIKFLFSCYLQIDKKSIMQKKIQREKTDSDFGFLQGASCLWGFDKKGCFIVYNILFLLQKRLK